MNQDDIKKLALSETAPQEGTTRPAAPPARATPVGADTLSERLRVCAKDCTELEVHYVLLHDAADMLERLAASQAREANLREAITVSLDTVGHAENARNILVNALSMPSDDTALRERMKEERALCAKVCNDRRRTVSNGNGISFFSHDAASIEAGFCADAILMLT